MSVRVNILLAAAIAASLFVGPAAEAQRRGEPAAGRVIRVAPQRIDRTRVEDAARRERLNAMTETRAAEEDRNVVAGLERDASGRLFRSAEVLLATDDATALAAARALGFVEVSRSPLDTAGLELITLRAPDGVSAADGVALLRAARPRDSVDLNFIYRLQDEALVRDGDADETSTPELDVGILPTSSRGGASIGAGSPIAALIDGPLREADAPGGVTLVSRRFVASEALEDPHAARVARLLIDASGAAGVDARLLSADVVSPVYDGASADALARALDWAAGEGASVINVSLAGPPNAAVEAVIARLAAREVLIVAAAGNDGPRAPPAYPAAYDGVLAVTAVNDRERIWRRANRGDYVDFAARGVRVEVDGARVSGTSYAAPVVAGALLALRASGANASGAVATLTARARDLGEPGRDPTFGAGLVEPAGDVRLAGR